MTSTTPPLITVDELIEQIKMAPDGPKVAAFFDFDGTLIDGYSAGALYAHRARNFELGPDEFVRTLRSALGGPQRRRPDGTRRAALHPRNRRVALLRGVAIGTRPPKPRPYRCGRHIGDADAGAADGPRTGYRAHLVYRARNRARRAHRGAGRSYAVGRW